MAVVEFKTPKLISYPIGWISSNASDEVIASARADTERFVADLLNGAGVRRSRLSDGTHDLRIARRNKLDSIFREILNPSPWYSLEVSNDERRAVLVQVCSTTARSSEIAGGLFVGINETNMIPGVLYPIGVERNGVIETDTFILLEEN